MEKLPGQVDVLVVGNGAIGLFLAEELTRRRIGSVAVVGPGARAGGASQAAGAMLGCFGEVTAETLRTAPARARFELGVAAHDLWPEVLERLGEQAPADRRLRTATDTHVVLNAVGAELDSVNFASILAALDAYDRPWTEIDPNDIPGYRPRADCRALRAIHLPHEGAVNARHVLAALEARLLATGVHVLDHTVRTLRCDDGAVTGAVLGNGHVITAGTTVVAAGVHSDRLVRTACADLALMPTFPGLGFAMVAKRRDGEPFRSVVRTPNRAFACGLHVVPNGDGREYLGATNRLVDDIGDSAWLADVRDLTQYAMQQLDEEIARHQIEQWLRGNRPVTLDGFPLIGWLPPDGLYLVTGTYRDGFHCAPVVARHVANELEGKEGLIDPMFRPMRGPIATRTIEHSVDEYVQHNLAAWFESGAQAAPQMTTTHLADYYRGLAHQLYDELGIDRALAPDILLYASENMVGARRVARYMARHRDDPMTAATGGPVG